MRQLLFNNSLIKSLMIGILSLSGNVFAGAYVFDITKTINKVQILDWRSSLESRSFWILLVILIVTGLYGWGATRYERKVRKDLNNEADLLNIALKELASPMIEAAKADIKAGRLQTLDEVISRFGKNSGGK